MKFYGAQAKFYGCHLKFYGCHVKFYGWNMKFYGRHAKFYGHHEKNYESNATWVMAFSLISHSLKVIFFVAAIYHPLNY